MPDWVFVEDESLAPLQGPGSGAFDPVIFDPAVFDTGGGRMTFSADPPPDAWAFS
jgi:hypothetical protein